MIFTLPFRTAGWLTGLLSIWVGCATTAVAQTRILFVGNSFTHGHFDPVRTYNSASVTDENFGLPSTSPRYEADASESGPWGGIPGIFKKFADEAGLNYEVHIEAISAKTLQYHYDNALSVIAQPWDKVVLQEYSTGALPTNRQGNRPAFYKASTSLEQSVHQANAQAQVYLYETWARSNLVYPAGQPYSGMPVDSMFADLHTGYYGALARNSHYAGVAPAGDAWLRAITSGVAMRNPYNPGADANKLNLWGADNYHPSRWGAYLNACVLFYKITGIDPTTLGASEQAAAALGIKSADAVALQGIAFQQVSQSPLPVQLVGFTARATSPATVALAWQTASETKSAYFAVERSADGVHFAQVAKLAAAGSSLTARAYAYIDAVVQASVLYYRLRQVDQDGAVAYSPVQTVVLPKVEGLTLYPNPAAGGTCQLSGVAPGAAVWVVDALGKVVYYTTASPAGAALLAKLPAGLYVVRADAGTARLVVE